MTRFLLAGTRPPGPTGAGGGFAGDELALAAAARRVVEAAAWQGWLRRWGLLLWFGLPRDRAAELRACLIVLASDDSAAERLAAGWGKVSGYQVTVLPLTSQSAGGRARESAGESGQWAREPRPR